MVLVSRASAYLVIYEFEVYGKALDVPARSVSVSVNDETMGTAYIGTEGTTSVEDTTAPVKLYAVANEGYEFVNWTVDGEVVSTSATVVVSGAFVVVVDEGFVVVTEGFLVVVGAFAEVKISGRVCVVVSRIVCKAGRVVASVSK